MHTTSPPQISSHSSTKSKNSGGEPKVHKKKKSWSLEARTKRKGGGSRMSRQQTKEMLLSKKPINKEQDVDAPPNSDAKDDSLRIFEQNKPIAKKEEFASKAPQIALKRQVPKKGKRRAVTLRKRKRKSNDGETPTTSSVGTPKEQQTTARSEDTPTGGDHSLFKERASANNSNANSPDNSHRDREARRIGGEGVDRTQADASLMGGVSATDTVKLALEPEPKLQSLQQQPRPTNKTRSIAGDKPSLPRIAKSAAAGSQAKDDASRAAQQQRANRSSMGLPPCTSTGMPKSEPSSTQLALEPEPDLERVRRQKETAFMKRFLTALKLLPSSATARPARNDSPTDSSSRPYQRKSQQLPPVHHPNLGNSNGSSSSSNPLKFPKPAAARKPPLQTSQQLQPQPPAT